MFFLCGVLGNTSRKKNVFFRALPELPIMVMTVAMIIMMIMMMMMIIECNVTKRLCRITASNTLMPLCRAVEANQTLGTTSNSSSK